MYADRSARTAQLRRVARAAAAALLICTVAVSAISAASAEQETSQGNWNGARQAYVREFEAGVRGAQLSDVDTNYLLSVLPGEVPTQRPETDLERLTSRPSLQHISATIIQLRELARTLQRRHGLRQPSSTGGDYIHVEDPDDIPPEPADPVISSWVRLKGIADEPPIVLARTQPAPPRSLPLQWRQPIRIASTGNEEYDSHVAAVVEELRRTTPTLPIDDQSFPNPVEQSNVFVDTESVLCPEGEACRAADMSSALRVAIDGDSHSPSQRYMLSVIAAYGQLRRGSWMPSAEIVPLDASTGLHVTSAWLRADALGNINTAMCKWVTGVGTDGWGRNDFSVPEGRLRATPDEIRRSVRACLGAAMGAPSSPPRWSVRLVPHRGSLCCLDPAATPSNYSQDEMLRQIYQ